MATTKKTAKKTTKKKAAPARARPKVTTKPAAAAKKTAKKPSPLKGTKKAAALPPWKEHATGSGFKILFRKEGGKQVIRVESPDAGIDLTRVLAAIAKEGGSPGATFAQPDEAPGADDVDKPYKLRVEISGETCTGKTTLAYWLTRELANLGAEVTVDDGEDGDNDDDQRTHKLAKMLKQATAEGLRLFSKQSVEIVTTQLAMPAVKTPRKPLPMRTFDAFIDLVNQLKPGSSVVIAGPNGVGKTKLAKRIEDHLGVVADFPVIRFENEAAEEDHPEAVVLHEISTRGKAFDGTEEIGPAVARVVSDADLVIGLDDDREHAHLIKNRLTEPFSFEL